MRVTIDLMKKSTQIIDLSNVINPRVGDDDLLLPLHIVYGDNQTDMRGKDVEFLSNDPNKKNIYIAGTCNTNTPGDNLYMGDLTFRFPAGTFKADGTYDPDKTMFRIVDKETQKVISSVNVKITVMKNNIEFDFDPDKSSYDSRAETMLQDFHDKGQTMLDEIKDLNNQAKSNVSGDTATTAKEAKKQADANAGDISDLKGEIAGARGRYADMAGREDAQDTAINQKESINDANANYAALKQKDAQQDAVLASKAGKFELESKLAQMDIQPEAFENADALKAKYPNGKSGLMLTTDTGHKWVWINGAWVDCGIWQAVGIDDSEKEKMLSNNSDNLIANSDFDGFDLWEISDQTDYEVQTYDAINNSHILYFIGKSGGAYISSKERKISNQSSVSWGVLIRGKDISSDNVVSVSLEFKDENHTKISSSAVQLNESYNTDSFRAIKLENVTIPANTAYIDLTVFQSGTSQVWVMRPQANFGSALYPYSFSDIKNVYAKPYISSSDNLIVNSDFASHNLAFWNVGGSPTPAYGFDDAHPLNNSNILYYPGNANAASYIASDNYGIGLHTLISAGVLIRGNNINSTDHIASVSLEFHDNLGNKLTSQAVQLDEGYNDSEFHFVKIEGATVPDGAVTVDLSFFQTSDSELWIARPQINFGATLIPYSLGSFLSTDEPATSKVNSALPHFLIQCNEAIGDKKVNAHFSFENDDRNVNGFMQISIQGASSRQYPKKNYKIKLFEDAKMTKKLKIKPRPSWTPDSSFNLKANWIDATQSRNLVNAKVFAGATAMTPFENEEVQQHLASTQNVGQMEGFPVIVYLNGKYHGLYTFNTKKTAAVFGMDSNNPEHEAITIEDNGAQAKLRDKTATVDMLHFATVVQDEPSDELKRNFTAFLNFLNTSSDSDFKSQIGNYIDVKSAINVYLYQALAEVWDGSTKSYIFLTYNGGKYFYLVDYDLDSSWGLWWDGSKVATDAAFDFTHPDQASFLTQENNNLLFQRIYQNFKPEIKSQYQKLRQSVWSNVSIMKQFKEFINSIPEAAYNHDHKVWPDIPSKSITSYSQIQNDIIRRGNQMDNWIDQLA